MRVVNVMISKVLGGVEQAFLDYSSIFYAHETEQLLITAKQAMINDKLPKADNIYSITCDFGMNGWLCVWRLYREIKKFRPDVIITHSKKVIPVLRFIANRLRVKLVAVAHNDKFKKINMADAIFSITQYQKNVFIKNGFSADNIYVIPNMIKEPTQSLPLLHKPVMTFGIIGRFDPCKGFTDFIEAFHLIKQRGYDIKAVIGGKAMGDYEQEERKIKDLVQKYGLNDDVKFLGWVSNKDDFYKQIDVFVLPSLYEPFGIVLLEAMSRQLPVISTLANGPAEIFANHDDCALTYQAGDVSALAENMMRFIDNYDLAQQVAENGFKLIKKYTPQEVGKRLINALKDVVK